LISATTSFTPRSLRIILAQYLPSCPSEIRFSYGPHGKPSAANASALAAELKFNLAHSGGLALYAITRRCELGVDLEKVRAEFASDQIAERFFSPNEVARLRSLPISKQKQAFFNCWIRKEAFIKAKSTGLSQALDQFEVTVGPDEPAALLGTKWDQTEAPRWLLKSIDLGSDFAAALAFEGRDRRISYWTSTRI
jgi:4'-phosphopantetheinyl transferase